MEDGRWKMEKKDGRMEDGGSFSMCSIKVRQDAVKEQFPLACDDKASMLLAKMLPSTSSR